MDKQYVIGLDFGTTSARGVLVDLESGSQVDHVILPYRHGLLNERLPSGKQLAAGSALHHPQDYLELLGRILSALGRGRTIEGIGVASTACSPLPVRADGSCLVDKHAEDAHAYIKLWKHGRAQPYADKVNFENPGRFGFRASGEGLIAKAAEVECESESVWAEAHRFIEVGDWIVWTLAGVEARSLDFAGFKAMHLPGSGYPGGLVPGLDAKLSKPFPVGSSAGKLAPSWLASTGIKGSPMVSVASIDSHAVLPAIGVVTAGTLVGVLGTSSGFLTLDATSRPLPEGYEASAFGAALPDLWCCEAGQAGFGDMLGWFVKTFPPPTRSVDGFAWYDKEADLLAPGENGLLALDWFGGNRVPYLDKTLSGLLVGLRVETSPVEIYRALIEALAFGVRTIMERAEAAGLGIHDVVLTSALARGNRFLVRTICDVLGRPVRVPDIDLATAHGAAIHAAVACGAVSGFAEGADRLGCHTHRNFEPDSARAAIYDRLYRQYVALSSDNQLRETMRTLSAVAKMSVNFQDAKSMRCGGGE